MSEEMSDDETLSDKEELTKEEEKIQEVTNIPEAYEYYWEAKKKNSVGKWNTVKKEIPASTNPKDYKKILAQYGYGDYKLTLFDAHGQCLDKEVRIRIGNEEGNNEPEEGGKKATLNMTQKLQEEILSGIQNNNLLNVHERVVGKKGGGGEEIKPENIKEMIQEAIEKDRKSRGETINPQVQMIQMMIENQKQTTALLIEVMKPREPKESSLEKFLMSPLAVHFFESLTKRNETPWEKILPEMMTANIQTVNQTVNGFMLKTLEMFEKAQFNNQSNLRQQLEFISALKDMAIPTIGEVAKIFTNLKKQSIEQNPQPNPVQQQKPVNNVQSGVQPKPQPINPHPEQQPETTPPQPKPQIDIQQQIDTAIEMIKNDKGENIPALGNEIIKVATDLVLLIAQNKKEDILKFITPHDPSKELLEKIEKVIDYYHELFELNKKITEGIKLVEQNITKTAQEIITIVNNNTPFMNYLTNLTKERMFRELANVPAPIKEKLVEVIDLLHKPQPQTGEKK